MPWKLTVRTGPRVERRRFADRTQALGALEARAKELVETAPQAPLDLRYKRYDPVQQVFARLELAGPERLLPSHTVGLDIRGDGSVEAYRGRVKRELIAPARGESPYAALRRTVEA